MDILPAIGDSGGLWIADDFFLVQPQRRHLL